MLKQYQVVLRPVGDTEPGGLQFMNAAPEAYAFFVNHDDNGNEVYSIEIQETQAGWLERQLDQEPGVISYKEVGERPGEEELDEELRQLQDETIFDDWPETEQERNRW